MTDHDAPTVARATLWLDTSSDTSTRRADCLEDCETLAFERPSLEPATSQGTHAATAPTAPPAETLALDRGSAFAAFEASATSTFAGAGLAAATSHASDARGRWRSIVSHGIAMGVGAASMACVLMMARSDSPPRATRAHEPQAQHAAKSAASVPNARLGNEHLQAQAQPSTQGSATIEGTADATLSGAVAALARGDYATAHAQYAALAAQRPHDAALVAVATLLAGRIEARCASDGHTGVACER